MTLSPKDKQDITEAIRFVESKSQAELVAVISQRVDGELYTFALLLVNAVFVAFFNVLFFKFFGILGICNFIFLFFLYHFLWGDRTNRFIISHLPKFYRDKQTKKYAQNAFDRLVAHKTKSKVGLMFFVSVTERHVQIIADDGIAKKINDKYWEKIVLNFTKNVQKGQFRKGYVDAIGDCANVLIKFFPIKEDDKNELPDEVVQL